MRKMILMTAIPVTVLLLTGCERSAGPGPEKSVETIASSQHTHADGSTHDDHADEPAAQEDDHAHDETPLGTITIGELEVELAQGHGKVAAGAEGHLVVKLPYNDKGATIVRAWLGTEDRTASLVGKGEYAASHDDYDVHAVAPDPLPENVMWWIEIERPDGIKVVGSAEPLK